MLQARALNGTKLLGKEIPSTLAEHCVHFHEKKIAGLKNFVGVRLDDPSKHPMIYLPHGFPDVKTLSEKKLRQSIFTLVQVLTKDHRKFEYQKATEHEDGLSNDFPFESFRYVIQDYLNRGYVKESERAESLHGSGRNDWRRTFNKRQPLWTEQGAVHLFPIKVKTVQSHQHLMEVQKYCVNISLMNLGWLYGKKPNATFKKWNNARITQAIGVIQRKKSTVFDERLTVLLGHLNIILKTQSKVTKAEKQNNLIGAENSMPMVWENMVESVFGTGKHEKYQPAATWTLTSEKEVEKQPLILDSIRWDLNDKGQKICTVIDAKYYRPGNLPTTTDVNKQITYAEWVRKQDGVQDPNEIQNIFILPAHLKNSVARYEGYATMGILEDKTKPYHKVHAISVDTLTLMDWYLRGNTSRVSEIVRLRKGSI